MSDFQSKYFVSVISLKAKMTGTLKLHTNFKILQLLKKSSQQHKIFHANTADQDLFRSFFRSLRKLPVAEICCFRIPQNA